MENWKIGRERAKRAGTPFDKLGSTCAHRRQDRFRRNDKKKIQRLAKAGKFGQYMLFSGVAAMQIAMIDDKIVPFEKLESVYLDRGTFFGDGVYEVLRSYNGRIFALEEHLERFENSLKAVDIRGIDMNQIRARLRDAFEAAGIANAKIYFHVTRGSAARNPLAKAGLKPNFFLTINPLSDDTAEKAAGIAVSTHPDWRWKRCDIKSLNLLANVLARQDAEKKGCDESILVNEAGLITEGASSAFFGIVGGAVRTSPLEANILPSITRKFVVKAAGKAGIEVAEKSLTPDEAGAAEELFIAVTTRDIVPVVKFDGKTVGDGRPGKYTKRLMEEFKAFLS